jgi:hypothetical protein
VTKSKSSEEKLHGEREKKNSIGGVVVGNIIQP